jgi:uncharacterized protein (DUF1684 family)
MSEYEDWLAWRASRVAEMAAAESWLSVIALTPIEGERASVGSAPDCAIRLPGGPLHAGAIAIRGISAEWQPATGPATPLDVDLDGIRSTPTPIDLGRHRLYVVERDGRLSVRVRDLEWASTQAFAGIDCFAYAPAWNVDASWERLASPMTLEVPSVTGELRLKTITHRALFSSPDGSTQALLPVYTDDENVLFVFRDSTSGRVSYGGGRFLRTAIPAGARIRLDFNRAYNPPCAFTPFATCPLPPPENWLPFAVEAGEKKYGK